MKNIIKRAGALALAGVLTVGLGVSALAYSTADFADVPAGNWAYEPVMKMADAGVIKGTSGTAFRPEMKVSPAMWLTLVGRAVYEADVKAAAQAGDEWFTAYVRVAQAKGLTTGTNITDVNLQGEMTRYDMAATVYTAIKLLGAKDATVDTAAIKDYGDIPTKYAAAVGQMYATGLIKGDGAGNFNGNNTMTRAEAATVMDRLITLKANLETPPTEPEKPTEEIPPRTGEMVEVKFDGDIVVDGNRDLKVSGANVQFYTKDWRLLGTAVSKDGVFTIETSIDKADYSLTDNIYHMTVTYVAPDGTKYSSIRKDTLAENAKFKSIYSAMAVGWGIYIYDDPNFVDLDF